MRVFIYTRRGLTLSLQTWLQTAAVLYDKPIVVDATVRNVLVDSYPLQQDSICTLWSLKALHQQECTHWRGGSSGTALRGLPEKSVLFIDWLAARPCLALFADHPCITHPCAHLSFAFSFDRGSSYHGMWVEQAGCHPRLLAHHRALFGKPADRGVLSSQCFQSQVRPFACSFNSLIRADLFPYDHV